jgi:hypothetical protein
MFIIDKGQRLKYYIYCWNLVAASVELLTTFTFPMLAYFSLILLQESSVEQARVQASPFKKRRGRKELQKKETVSVINRMCILLSLKQQSALSIH